VSLEGSTTRVADPAWIDGLLDAFANPDADARARALGRFDESFGTASWLEWLSGEDVHRVMVEWRELTGMASWLSRLPERIEAFEEITTERRRRTAAAAELLNETALLGRRAELALRIEQLERDLSELQRQSARPEPDWMRKLATAEERRLIEDLSAKSALVTAHMPAAERARFQARIDRLMGVVFWQIADDRMTRARALARQLNESRDLLADIDTRIERLAGAEQQFAAGVETDFLALTRRTDRVSERVAGALDARRRTIARALQQGLEQEMARTRQYLLTARIAIARATDQLAAATPDAGADES
jgi:hypothetical protein